MNMIVQSFAPDDRAVKTVCGGSKEAGSEGDAADEGRVRTVDYTGTGAHSGQHVKRGDVGTRGGTSSHINRVLRIFQQGRKNFS